MWNESSRSYSTRSAAGNRSRIFKLDHHRNTRQLKPPNIVKKVLDMIGAREWRAVEMGPIEAPSDNETHASAIILTWVGMTLNWLLQRKAF
jgi:hypothetical protein